jgi:hypothetical protein
MARFVALPMRVGQKTTEPVTKEFRSLYSLVASWFIGSRAECASSNLTIPLSNEADLHDRASDIYERLAKSNADLVVIDLANSPRGLLPQYSVVHGLMEICERALQIYAGVCKVVLLFPDELWNEDPVMVALRPLVGSGHAWIVTDRGGLTGASPPNGIEPAAYEAALRAARSSPLWLLRQKLVRQHGHFFRYREGTHHHCVYYYYYDGQHCTNEITFLLAETLDKPGLKSRIVLLEDPNFDWLKGGVEAATIKSQHSLRTFKLTDPGLGIDGQVPDEPIIILSICDTADNFSKIIGALLQLNPACNPHVISLMSTEGSSEERGRRIVSVGQSQYTINYFLKVGQPKYPAGQCRQCRCNVPPSSSRDFETDPAHLSSFAMWSMIIESGLKGEQDVPQGRPSLGLVPDFPELIDKNGPYIARKMHKTLTTMKGSLPRDPIVICPDEIGAKALADALTHLFKYTVNRVPREVIDKRSQVPANASDTGDNTWILQLQSLQARNDETELIVLDEFNATGGTRTRLRELLERFGLGVRCYFSLFDFNPLSRIELHRPTYMLYSLNWLGDQPNCRASE